MPEPEELPGEPLPIETEYEVAADDDAELAAEVGATDAPADDPARPPAAAPDAAEPPEHPLPTRAAVVRAFLRPSKGQLAVGLLCFVLGLGGVVQVRAQQGTQAYSGQRREDLVALIDSLNKEHARLESEQQQLETTKSDLQSGADKQKVATDEANRRIDQLGILSGTSSAVGPGVRLVISDPQHKVTPAMLLDAIEELRDSGAEAIELNDSIRVVANTAFVQGPQGIEAGGQVVNFPLQIDAIGNSATLEGGARFRGGIVSQVQAPTVGGAVVITRLDAVDITATVALPQNTYAKPAK